MVFRTLTSDPKDTTQTCLSLLLSITDYRDHAAHTTGYAVAQRWRIQALATRYDMYGLAAVQRHDAHRGECEAKGGRGDAYATAQ